MFPLTVKLPLRTVFSSTVKLLVITLTVPVPFACKSTFPLVFCAEIILASILILSTSSLVSILTAPSNCDVPSTLKVPSTSRLSLTLTIPPPSAERIRFAALRVVIVFPSTLRLSTHNSENDSAELPRGAPLSVSGKNPSVAVAIPVILTPVLLVFILRASL